MSEFNNLKLRLNLSGKNLRESKINDARKIHLLENEGDPSYCDSMFFYDENNETNLDQVHIRLFDEKSSSSYGTVTGFNSLYEEPIVLGDTLYNTKNNTHYICVESKLVADIHYSGQIARCNYLLKWQNEDGKIIKRYAIIQSASKYNDGVESESSITNLGSDQLSVIVSIDDETLKLKKEDKYKFFIDLNKDRPTTYLLSGTGNVEDSFNGHGITHWIVKECAYTPTLNDLKYGVCNYKATTSTTEDETVSDEDEMTVLSANILGNNMLKTGIPRTYTVEFTDSTGETVNCSNFSFNVVFDKNIYQKVDGNKIIIQTNDKELIGEKFKLQVLVGTDVLAEKEIEIVRGLG